VVGERRVVPGQLFDTVLAPTPSMCSPVVSLVNSPNLRMKFVVIAAVSRINRVEPYDQDSVPNTFQSIDLSQLTKQTETQHSLMICDSVPTAMTAISDSSGNLRRHHTKLTGPNRSS
jgi:hypothetical protein